MRKKAEAPPAAAVPVKRAQPRLAWRRRPIAHRTAQEWADQLALNGQILGEVVPVIEGNPLRGPVVGYVFVTHANDPLGLAALHSGDRPGPDAPLCFQSADRAAAQVALATYVQACLRQRGLRP